jgi:Replication-relaxation
MRGELSARSYVSERGLARLRSQLSERDLAVLRLVAALRLMDARQIQAVHFPLSEHMSELAATRARQRVIARLLRERLLTSLVRRIGGVRAGSAGLVLALGPLAPRTLRLGKRRRVYEPSERFVDHTLAVSQLIVDAIVASRGGQLDLLDWQSEPTCWRSFGGLAGRQTLRPDAYLCLGVAEYELRWFCEVDRATESLPTVLRKCRLYADYYQSGTEQANSGVFPRVCWIAPDAVRTEQLRDAIERDRQLPEGLFVVSESERALKTLTVSR